jgi:hypothetical protein
MAPVGRGVAEDDWDGFGIGALAAMCLKDPLVDSPCPWVKQSSARFEVARGAEEAPESGWIVIHESDRACKVGFSVCVQLKAGAFSRR